MGVGVGVSVGAAAGLSRRFCCNDRYCDGCCDPSWDRGCGGSSKNKRAPAAEGSIGAGEDTTESLEHLGVVDICKARAARTPTTIRTHTHIHTAQNKCTKYYVRTLCNVGIPMYHWKQNFTRVPSNLSQTRRRSFEGVISPTKMLFL